MRVCIILEGSYPFITGGVSAWVHDLLLGLPDLEFSLFTISPEPNMPLRYKLPPNVVEHRNFVVSDPHPSTVKLRNPGKLLKEIVRIHGRFLSGDVPDLTGLIRSIPEGYNLSKLALRSKEGWAMVVEANQRRNPIYPFTDYFWAWYSAHALLFRVLAASLPEADVYHAVSTGFAGLAAYAARARTGRPLLLTEHGLYHKEREMEIRRSSLVKGYQRDLWISIYNQISRLCYRKADLITALFEENRQYQMDFGAPEERTLVLPNGIDIERYSVSRYKRPGFHVGLVGRVVPIKDVKTFILAAKIVLDEVKDARFYCIGPTDEDPAYYEDCRMLVESLKIGDRFEFTGRKNVLDYYAFLDVVALTSVKEAQPLVILEAYCAGIPVVSTRVGNVPEMLDYDDRFLAYTKDSVQIAKGILYIYNHPEEIRELAAQNREKVRTFYDKQLLLERIRGIYQRLGEEKA